MKILFAEDSLIDQKVFLRFLKKYPHLEVVVASDGMEAFEFYKSAPEDFNIVVTDINMPRMTGFDLARELCAYEEKVCPRIFFLTSSNNPEDQLKIKEFENVNGYILKPITKEKVAKFLEPFIKEC